MEARGYHPFARERTAVHRAAMPSVVPGIKTGLASEVKLRGARLLPSFRVALLLKELSHRGLADLVIKRVVRPLESSTRQ